MPHPTREARLTRAIVLMDMYDEVRATGVLPSLAEFHDRLKLNTSDCGILRRDIGARCGIPVPLRQRRLRLELSEIPGAPGTLTRTERDIYQVLVEARGEPVMARDLYARATGVDVAYVVAANASAHIMNMRRKGCRIASTRAGGYWLEADCQAAAS